MHKHTKMFFVIQNVRNGRGMCSNIHVRHCHKCKSCAPLSSKFKNIFLHPHVCSIKDHLVLCANNYAQMGHVLVRLSTNFAQRKSLCICSFAHIGTLARIKMMMIITKLLVIYAQVQVFAAFRALARDAHVRSEMILQGCISEVRMHFCANQSFLFKV